MNSNIFDALRYRSEGTDLDFKQAQYRFVRGAEPDKAELLKDVLAMANAWREGTAYILIGFRDARPHPAETVGLSEHIDDASLQQFINSKVKPKVTFRYEEHTYEGKNVAVLVIPKQPRPFYLQHAYGGLKSNVVYVRRGSSTDEAEPPEIAKMALADVGRGEPLMELTVNEASGSALAQVYERAFLTLEKLPDYELRSERDPFGLASVSIWRANSRFWRELGRFVAARLSTVEIGLSLKNRSGFALSGTKLEVSAQHLDGQGVKLVLGEYLPGVPESQYSTLHMPRGGLANAVGAREPRMTVDDGTPGSICHIRLGTLLPGESARGSDTLGLKVSGPGRVVVTCRILAAELPAPLEETFEFKVEGSGSHLDLDGLKALIKQPLAQSLLASVVDKASAAEDAE